MYEELTFTLPDVELRGRIYRPEGDGPHPVVIFHSGVGSVAEGNYPYADLFTELGLAVVFYDHRGLGYSGGSLRQELDPVQNARDLRDGSRCSLSATTSTSNRSRSRGSASAARSA